MTRAHVWGFVAGVGAVYLFHRFVRPIPGGKGA